MVIRQDSRCESKSHEAIDDFGGLSRTFVILTLVWSWPQATARQANVSNPPPLKNLAGW